MSEREALVSRVHTRWLREVNGQISLQKVHVAERLRTLLFEENPLLSAHDIERSIRDIERRVFGFGGLEPFLRDPEVSEIMLNGPGQAFVERAGVIIPIDLQLDAAAIEVIVQRVLAPLGLRLDRGSPLVDARLPDGSRLHAVAQPLAPDGPIVTIRRFREKPIQISDFLATAGTQTVLQQALENRETILIAGATSTGKTSLINAVSEQFAPEERVVTVEETLEIQLRNRHWVRLEAHPANAEGAGQHTIRDLVRASLRMRPDRLIVGEVRGAEALDLLLALNTGHRGSLSTIHANSAPDALRRLAILAMLADASVPHDAVRTLVHAAIDLVVFLVRDANGTRRIAHLLRPNDGEVAMSRGSTRAESA